MIALGTAVVAFLGLMGARNIAVRRLATFAAQTETDLDDLAAKLLRSTSNWFVLLLALFIGSRSLTMASTADTYTTSAATVAVLLQAALWGTELISYVLERYTRLTVDDEPGVISTLSVLGFVARVVMWATVLLLALDNIGVEITGLIAGLGISGIAVALAVQNILGDLFAYLSIMLDRPFAMGDFIVVDDILGTVERIGLKSTRVRSLTGELIVFSNTDLLSTRLRNYQDRQERRVAFSIGVVYETPADTLKAIPNMIREIVSDQESARFDRAHFKSLGSFSLDFEIVYYVTSADYLVYMDCQEAINIETVRRFEKEGISFAFPTQTLHVDRMDAN